MNKLKKLFIAVALFGCSVSFAGYQGVAVAGPFDGSTKEACKGASLGKSSDCEPNNDCSAKSAESNCQIERTIQRILDLLTMIVGIVAVILIIINGLRFITANGDSNSISSARSGIIYALVGLIIVALAQAIVRFVLSRV